MGLFTRMKYWDIWYDRKSLSLVVILIALVVLFSSIGIYSLVGGAGEEAGITPTTGNVVFEPKDTVPSQTPLPEESKIAEKPEEEVEQGEGGSRAARRLIEPEFSKLDSDTVLQCQQDFAAAQINLDIAEDAEEDAEDEVDERRQDVRDVVNELDRERERLEELQDDGNATASAISSQERKIKNLEEDLEQEEEDFADAEDTLDVAEQAVEEAKNHLNEIKDQCRNVDLLSVTLTQQDVITNDQDRDPFIANCPFALEEARRAVKRARDELDEAEEDLENEREELNKLEEELTRAEDRLEDLDDGNATSDQIDAQEDVIENIEQRIKDQEDDIDEAEEAINDAEDDVQEAEDNEREIRDICRTQGAHFTLFQAGAEDFDALLREAESITDCTTAIARVESLALTAEDTEDDAREDLQEKQDERREAEERLDKAETDLDAAVKNNATSSEIDRLEERRDRFRNELEDAEQDETDAEDYLDEIKDDVAAAKLLEKRIKDRCRA